uniref:Uncharacterized protein n=1 Tax=Glossina brevipalpis TaxID=37001 RepID=A0A1A9X3M5_9MUSC
MLHILIARVLNAAVMTNVLMYVYVHELKCKQDTTKLHSSSSVITIKGALRYNYHRFDHRALKPNVPEMQLVCNWDATVNDVSLYFKGGKKSNKNGKQKETSQQVACIM